MQESIFFENQIIKPSNLDFMNASTAKNVEDIVSAFTGGNPGVASGLLVDVASIGTSTAIITTGYGFLATGERVQLYSPSGITTLTYSGRTSIFASLIEVNYNPNPSENPAGAVNTVSGLNAGSLEFQAVEQYNLLQLTTTSGATFIKLVDVLTSGGHITGMDYTNRQNLKIGEIDLFSNTIDGSIITPSSIDSNQFVSPLHYDINIASGVNVNFLGSGNQSIGSTSLPLASIVAISGTFHDISGFSPIAIDSLVQKSGTSLESSYSHVNIDTANAGTKLGGGLVIGANSIDLSEVTTSPAASTLTISTASLNGANINLNAGGTINITPGNASAGVNINSPLTVAGVLTAQIMSVPSFAVNNLSVTGAVTGDVKFLNNVEVDGNLVSSGSLAFASTQQQFENIIPNGLMYPSGNIVSGTNIPNVWTAANPDANYVIGPIGTTVGRYLTLPSALNSAMIGMTQYTMEWVFSAANLTGSIVRLYAARASSPSNPRFEIAGNRLYYYNLTYGGVPGGLGTGFVVWTNTGQFQNNRFYHVALTVSGSVTKLFVDGIQPTANSSNLNYGANIPSSITDQNIGYFTGDSTNVDGNLFIKGFKVSALAHTVFPSGLVNLVADPDTMALYNFNNSPSGIDKSGFGRDLSVVGSPMPFYEAPSGVGTVGSNFLGQSFSGSSVLDYTKDIIPIGSMNVLSGSTNSPYFFQVSGNNITNNGVTFSTPLNVENSKEYNISYFTKMISGSSVTPLSSNLVAVRAYVAGTGYVSPLYSGTNLNGQWTQNSFDFITPNTTQNLNLYINTYSAFGNTISGTSMLGLSSVQATRGSAKLEVIDRGSKIITLSHTGLSLPSNTTNTYFSGTIFSNGGMATISPSIILQPFFTIPISTNDIMIQIRNIVTLNGNIILSDEDLFKYPNGSNFYGVVGYRWLKLNRSWTGYLQRGPNTLVCKLIGLWDGNQTWSASNPIGIQPSKTDIIMY